MRSLVVTIFLALAAALALGLSAWQIKSGNLDEIFGVPFTKRGSLLYPDLKVNEVRRLVVVKNGLTFSAKRTSHGWECETPWNDRMDARAAELILQFIATTRVIDGLPREKFQDSDTGLDDIQATNIRLENQDGRPLAKFYLGTKSPWSEPIVQQANPNQPNAQKTSYAATVYIRPYDKNRKDFTYVCEGDINGAFRNQFAFLRDHQPFSFNPLTLQSIQIQDKEGLLTLERNAEKSPWRITKPLELTTSPNQMKNLLEGLFYLRAKHVTDRNGKTLPSTGQKREISLHSFGLEKPVTLTIYQPDPSSTTSTPQTLLATVSDRPNCLFELPETSLPDLPALDQIPLSVNDLRDKNLSRINPANLGKIEISAATLPEPILLEHPKGKRWTFVQGQESQLANELRLYDLLQAVTQTEAQSFVTDAAVDGKNWGLDRPILTLRFFTTTQPRTDGASDLTLLFGLGADGSLYASREKSSTVMKVSREFLSKISIKPYEWRDARAWNLSRVDIVGIKREINTQAPLQLEYDFLDESWKSPSNAPAMEIDPDRANFLLTTLESLSTERWLAPNDPAALAALKQPVMRISVISKKIDADGNAAGLEKRELHLARSSDPQFFYATIVGENAVFTLSADRVIRLTTDVFSR